MVEVRWDFQGRKSDLEAAERAVARVLAFYKEALAGTLCPVHQQEPWLKVSGPYPKNLTVSIEACCDQLLELAKLRIGQVSRRDRE